MTQDKHATGGSGKNYLAHCARIFCNSDIFATVHDHWSAGAESVNTLAQRMVDAVAEPFNIDNNRFNIGISVGISAAPLDGTERSGLLQRADLALYRAKADGRSQFRRFDREMQIRAHTKREVKRDLERAVSEGQFILHYQPLVDLGTGKVNGYEALLRWKHPRRGMLQPIDFINVAEDTGLIVPLGAWVIAEACREAMTWQEPLTVSVNVSALQISDGRIFETVRDALILSALDPKRLELEITESVILDQSDRAMLALKLLRQLGVVIAMDDFGTGYSSFGFLRKFPVDKIKIDRSFVKGITSRPQDTAIIRAIVAIGASMNLRVLAEGVETMEESAVLQELGCQEAQGYYFGKPAAV